MRIRSAMPRSWHGGVFRLTGLLAALALIAAACEAEPADDTAVPDPDADEVDEAEEPDDTADEPADGEGLVFTGFYLEENIQEFLDAWEEHRPDIPVTYQEVPFVDLNDVIEARLGAGDATPDVYTADQPRIANLVARGFLEDITDDFPDAETTWLPATVEASSVDDRLYAAPLNSSTQLMYFNLDWFEGTDVELPSASPDDRWTWDEAVEAARAAMDNGAPVGLQFHQMNRIYQMQPLPESLGGGPGLSGDDYMTPDLVNDGWVEAMEWYQMIHEEGIAPRGVTPEEITEMWYDGQVAIFISGSWTIGNTEVVYADQVDFEYAVAAHPVFEGGEPVTPTGSWSWGINPNTQNREAAVEFLRFASENFEGNQVMLEVDPNIPANRESLEAQMEDELFQAEYGGTTVADLVTHELESTARIRAPSEAFIIYEEFLQSALEDIRNGEPIVPTLERTEEELGSALERL
jgi:multiple sugar transport system substrate-binding protein